MVATLVLAIMWTASASSISTVKPHRLSVKYLKYAEGKTVTEIVKYLNDKKSKLLLAKSSIKTACIAFYGISDT